MDKVSSRYAQAMVEIAQESHQLTSFKAQAKIISKTFKENPDFGSLFQKIQISSEEKKALILSVYQEKIDPMLINLMYVLVDKHRMMLVDAIMDDFIHLANEHLNIEEGLVYSIRALADEDLKALENQLSLKHNVSVELINRIDPSLISGLRIKFKESVIDASLSAKLEALRETLREGRS